MCYARPSTLTEALRILSWGPQRILAGGTDLYPGAGAELSGDVLDVTGIAALRGITPVSGGLRIGACTTWTDIAEEDLPSGLDALRQAARQIGGRQIQNAGTIGGNLCNASPAADGVPPLLASAAEVELTGPEGTRRLALADFITAPRRTALHPGELLTAVLIPPAGLHGQSQFLKLGARSYLVISIAMVSARIVADQGRVTLAALAVGACSGVAVRLPELEQALIGARLEDMVDRIDPAAVAAALSPIDDVRATAAYRAEAAAVLLSRAVAGCAS
jgi:CO/xanthine dehydrogenase FAD-binding subunit